MFSDIDHYLRHEAERYVENYLLTTQGDSNNSGGSSCIDELRKLITENSERKDKLLALRDKLKDLRV